MGQQPSALNCKINQADNKSQITTNKQYTANPKKNIYTKQQNDLSSTNFQTQNVIGVKSPRNELKKSVSQKNISSKASRQAVKQKIFIPQFESITKISQTSFPRSIRQNKYFTEQKFKSLGQIVESRYNSTKHFPYSQILGLTESLVYSLAYLTKKRCNHHDFYPTNIYYFQGKFKVINPLQIQSSGFYLTSQRQRFSFLSPELIIAILQQISEQQLDEEVMSKSDLFAVGMILLEVCSLQPSSECYDQESYNIVDSVIKDRINKVSKVYTQNMAESINLMLQYEVEKRLDPISLAQFIHMKIDNQKQIALQMEAPKNMGPASGPNQAQMQGPPKMMGPPQQGPPHQGPHQQGPPPGMNMPPQMINRGPPPPYNHQPFKMQNLNPNIIAVTVPNQSYTRIGPNNQGFLSSSSLQQKLRVIQLIRENPNEEDQQGQSEKNHKKIETQQSSQDRNPKPIKSMAMQAQGVRPQYPMVESIYNQKPFQFNNIQKELKGNLIPQGVNQNQRQGQGQFQPESRQKKEVFKQITQPAQFQHNPFLNQARSFEQKKLPQFISTNLRKDNIPTIQQQKSNLPSGFSYGTAVSPKSSPSLVNIYKANQINQINQGNNIYTSNQMNNQQNNLIPSNNQLNRDQLGLNPSFENYQTSPNAYINKYGTSFQNKTQGTQQSLEQRVARVLNMSRNAH